MFRAPEGATIDYTDAYAKRLEEITLKVPEVDRVFSVAGTHASRKDASFLRLKPWDERERTQQEIAHARAKDGRGARRLAFPINPPPLGQSARDKPVSSSSRPRGPTRSCRRWSTR